MKEKILKSIPGLLTIAGGNLLYAFVVALFILPGQIISCGTTGLALVAQRLWGIPVSGFVLVFNVVMLVLGGLILGRKFAMTTILSSFLYPVFLSFAQYVVGDFVVTENLLLCALFGGMDIPPLILKKLFGIPVPITLWLFDFLIMLSQLFFHTAEDLLYGVIMLIAVNFTLNKTLVAGTGRTEVKIISDHAVEIRDSILKNADRGVTMLHGEGGYLHGPTEVVLSVVAARELHRVLGLARAIDPECFMVVTQVTEVWGRGFSSGKKYV